MRQAYLVTYDLCDPKRLRRVFKVMRGHGLHLQYSVFLCELNRTELAHLRGRLSRIIHHGVDQVLFADLGPADTRGSRAIDAIGRPYVPPSRDAVVV